jgi:hypothetical protein
MAEEGSGDQANVKGPRGRGLSGPREMLHRTSPVIPAKAGIQTKNGT